MQANARIVSTVFQATSEQSKAQDQARQIDRVEQQNPRGGRQNRVLFRDRNGRGRAGQGNHQDGEEGRVVIVPAVLVGDFVEVGSALADGPRGTEENFLIALPQANRFVIHEVAHEHPRDNRARKDKSR